MHPNLIQKIKTAPKDPGVYIFYKNQIPLYIGKASNLKNRLQNYLKITDYKNEALHREANKLKLLKLRSNIEALITESQLIKTLKPKLNILWKDDKNYFYVAISQEKFPKIYTTHQINEPKAEYIGPFTDGQSIKAILRLLRKFFPYCTCFQLHLRLCLNAQIGNCLGFCCQQNANLQMNANAANIKNYRKNIKKIKNILTGKDKKFIRQLKDPYELLVLEKIWQHEPFLKSNNLKAKNSKLKANRIECYDNSHLSGKEAVGAMTAWRRLETNDSRQMTTWTADKNSWRKFKHANSARFAKASRNANAPMRMEDDATMIYEMLARRLNHPEWPYPDLIIIDGGITQLNAAKKALSKLPITNYQLPKIIAFAKPHQQVYGWKNNPVPLASLPEELQKLIPAAIQHTHNFVQRYHRQVRQKEFLKLY